MMREFWNEIEAASETGGLTGVEDSLAVVIAVARRHGLDRVNGVVLDVLADTTAAEVVRWRALARLTPALMTLPETPPLAPAEPAPSLALTCISGATRQMVVC